MEGAQHTSPGAFDDVVLVKCGELVCTYGAGRAIKGQSTRLLLPLEKGVCLALYARASLGPPRRLDAEGYIRAGHRKTRTIVNLILVKLLLLAVPSLCSLPLSSSHLVDRLCLSRRLVSFGAAEAQQGGMSWHIRIYPRRVPYLPSAHRLLSSTTSGAETSSTDLFWGDADSPDIVLFRYRHDTDEQGQCDSVVCAVFGLCRCSVLRARLSEARETRLVFGACAPALPRSAVPPRNSSPACTTMQRRCQ